MNKHGLNRLLGCIKAHETKQDKTNKQTKKLFILLNWINCWIQYAVWGQIAFSGYKQHFLCIKSKLQRCLSYRPSSVCNLIVRDQSGRGKKISFLSRRMTFHTKPVEQPQHSNAGCLHFAKRVLYITSEFQQMFTDLILLFYSRQRA